MGDLILNTNNFLIFQFIVFGSALWFIMVRLRIIEEKLTK